MRALSVVSKPVLEVHHAAEETKRQAKDRTISRKNEHCRMLLLRQCDTDRTQITNR
jgi:hypothetical protein